jgi:hypothetical protein
LSAVVKVDEIVYSGLISSLCSLGLLFTIVPPDPLLLSPRRNPRLSSRLSQNMLTAVECSFFALARLREVPVCIINTSELKAEITTKWKKLKC